jgi:hypothetical protein
MAMKNSDTASKSNDTDSVVIRTTQNYMKESYEARRERIRLNRLNYDIFHHRQDYSHKKPGQSQEFLPKQQMAVEQLSSFVSQGLVDLGHWFNVEKQPGIKQQRIDPAEVYLMLQRQLEKTGFVSFVGDGIKTGSLGSLMIAKVHGRNVPSSKFFTQSVEQNGKFVKKLFKAEKDTWELFVELIRPESYYPDPTGAGVYECEVKWVDKSTILEMAQGPDAIYDYEKVNKLHGYAYSEYDQAWLDKDRETDHSRTYSDYRVRVKLTECWGDIIEPTTGEKIFKNVTWTIANDTVLIAPPKPNPFWHGKSPFIVAPITRVPFSVWHRAPMDGATRHNIALNELYNLMVDAGMMSVFGIKQIRTDWLEDEREVADGVRPGMTLRASSNCPPGAAVLQRVDEGALSPEAVNMFNIMNAELNSSAMTNDLRMGAMPARAVKATEVVEASQTITSMFAGIARSIEVDFIEPILDMAWKVIMQNANDLDSDEVKALIGEEKANVLATMSPEDRFAETVQGNKFKVFGVSQTLNKQKDFRKLTALLQTIGSSEVLVESFIKKYSFEKLLGEIVRSLDIEPGRIEQDELDQLMMKLGPQALGQGTTQPGAQPNMQSQIPQAASEPVSQDIVQSNIPRNTFPPSPAVKGLT